MRLVDFTSLALVIIILLVLLGILIILNRKERQKIKSRIEKIFLYKRSLNEISPDKIEDFNKLVRGFFKDLYGFDYSLTYLELAKKFKEINEKSTENFCILMSNALYSGTEIDESDIGNLRYYFSRILERFEK